MSDCSWVFLLFWIQGSQSILKRGVIRLVAQSEAMSNQPDNTAESRGFGGDYPPQERKTVIVFSCFQ